MSMESITLTVKGMSCIHCVKAVKNGLDQLPGVSSVSVNLEEGKVAVDYDTTGTNIDKIKKVITEEGYEVE